MTESWHYKVALLIHAQIDESALMRNKSAFKDVKFLVQLKKFACIDNL